MSGGKREREGDFTDPTVDKTARLVTVPTLTVPTSPAQTVASLAAKQSPDKHTVKMKIGLDFREFIKCQFVPDPNAPPQSRNFVASFNKIMDANLRSGVIFDNIDMRKKYHYRTYNSGQFNNGKFHIVIMNIAPTDFLRIINNKNYIICSDEDNNITFVGCSVFNPQSGTGTAAHVLHVEATGFQLRVLNKYLSYGGKMYEFAQDSVKSAGIAGQLDAADAMLSNPSNLAQIEKIVAERILSAADNVERARLENLAVEQLMNNEEIKNRAYCDMFNRLKVDETIAARIRADILQYYITQYIKSPSNMQFTIDIQQHAPELKVAAGLSVSMDTTPGVTIEGNVTNMNPQ